MNELKNLQSLNYFSNHFNNNNFNNNLNLNNKSVIQNSSSTLICDSFPSINHQQLHQQEQIEQRIDPLFSLPFDDSSDLNDLSDLEIFEDEKLW